MRQWKSASAALVSLSLFGAAAQAAPCTTPAEWAALKSAAVQQELMVAGLTCQAIGSYNRFVIAYRGELQASDANLKAYFIKRQGARGEAAYDTFKTKLANLSSLSEISNTSGFCASMQAAFNQVGRQSLAQFVAEQRLLIALPEQQFCTTDPARPVFAGAAAPDRFAAAEPARRGPPVAYQPQRDAEEGEADFDDAAPPAYRAPRSYGPQSWAPPPYPRAPAYYGR
jgi:hypothetical protein